MKKVIALLISIMMVLALALPATAISSTTKPAAVKKVKIKFAVWDAHLGAKEFMSIKNEFNKQSETTQLEISDLPGASYNDKLAVILAAGQFLDGITIKGFDPLQFYLG